MNVPVANAVLSGWNIGIVTLFVSAVILSAFAHSADLTGTASTVVIVVLVILLSFVCGILAGRRLAGWFAKRSPTVNVIWLIGLVLVTLALLPAPFQFMIVDV